MSEQRTRSAKRALAGLFLLWAGSGAAAAQTAPDCAGRLDLAETSGTTLQLSLSAPCAPYAPVAIALGSVRFAEETGIDGTLELELPKLDGIGHLAVSTATQTIVAPIAPHGGLTDYVVAVAAPPSLPMQMRQGEIEATELGFPSAEPRAHVLALQGDDALQIELPVTSATCGTETAVDIRHGSGDGASTLSVRMPGCDRTGSSLHLLVEPPR